MCFKSQFMNLIKNAKFTPHINKTSESRVIDLKYWIGRYRQATRNKWDNFL